jgi:hypothetical protein
MKRLLSILALVAAAGIAVPVSLCAQDRGSIHPVNECPAVESNDPSGTYTGHVDGYLSAVAGHQAGIYNLGDWELSIVGIECQECAAGQFRIFGTFKGVTYVGQFGYQETGVVDFGIMNPSGDLLGFRLVGANCKNGATETFSIYDGGSFGIDPGDSMVITPAGIANGHQQPARIHGHLSGTTCYDAKLKADITLTMTGGSR